MTTLDDVISSLPRYKPIPVGTREYVKTLVSAYEDGQPVDPIAESATTSFAFVPTSAGSTPPDSGAWHVGGFEKSGERFFARILVGTGGGVVLGADEYVVWCRITNSPEQPTRPVGILPVV